MWSLEILGVVLWSWELCCRGSRDCDDPGCPSRRMSRLQHYYNFCKLNFEAHADGSCDLAELSKTILGLRSNPHVTRRELGRTNGQAASDRSPDEVIASGDVVVLAVKIMAMIDCSPMYGSLDRLERGHSRVHWREDEPFDSYLERRLTPQNLNHDSKNISPKLSSRLRARKLIKHLGVEIRPTNDIRDHLRLDRERNILEIFHHTAFLKEQLRLTKNRSLAPDFSSAIKIGALPRQLALEVLDSLQNVLFPLSDPKSKRLLKSLVSRCYFDPDILHFEFISIRSPGEETLSYVYLTDKLMDLHREVEDPAPRGWLERRLERRSGARHMMMATMVGVTFAVVLGMASLAMTSYQSWIAYQAWQHPVAPPVTPV